MNRRMEGKRYHDYAAMIVEDFNTESLSPVVDAELLIEPSLLLNHCRFLCAVLLSSKLRNRHKYAESRWRFRNSGMSKSPSSR